MRLAVALLLVFPVVALGQEANPTQRLNGDAGPGAPLYHVDVVARSTPAVNYGHRSAPTTIGFAGTILQPDAKGAARVEAKRGVTQVRAKLKNLAPPQTFGRQFLTYVLWAITPDGRATNLGELITDAGDDGKLETATELQSFALILTAEPYYAVTQPSDVVVAENEVRPDTVGRVEVVNARYELLRRGRYTYDLAAAAREQRREGRRVSQREYESLVELYQARHAVELAAARGAELHSAGALARARAQLEQAERRYQAKPKSREVAALARAATQTAEDARLIAARHAGREPEMRR